jgi:predicted DNA-binding transcriptional regulator YafY
LDTIKGEAILPKKRHSISKTERILMLLYLFGTCQEVTKQEIKECIGDEFCEKTISRDIALIKQAGWTIRYSVRDKVYYETDEPREPKFPTGKKERQYIERIIRLNEVMILLRYGGPDGPVDVWYEEAFPNVSRRTMQRDFNIINSVFCEVMYYFGVRYKRKMGEWDDEDQIPGYYYLMDGWW